MNSASAKSTTQATDSRSLWKRRLSELHPRRFFVETWRQMDLEALEERQRSGHDAQAIDRQVFLTLFFGLVCLTLMEYPGMPSMLRYLVSEAEGMPFQAGAFIHHPFAELSQHAWWAGWRVLGYFILPVIAIKASGQKLRDQGLSLDGFWSHLWIYGLCLIVVLICVYAVSFTEEFSTYYPFYDSANRSWVDFLTWEVLYAAQFFSLEFFFRGWWLNTCKRAMGSQAIFVMVLPYVMIHFGKPPVETLAAIIAGVVLGTLAMKTRSIWSGFLIHVSVALSMDLAALLQTRGLPETLWPAGF